MAARWCFFLLACFPTLYLGATEATVPWAVVYSADVELESLQPYQLLVLDSEHHPPLRILADHGKTLLGYLSLGEVNHERPYYQGLKRQGLLLQENRNWPGSYFIDIRSKVWQQQVIDDLIPAIIHEGFDGVFLDTLDNAAYLEAQQPQRYHGMKRAAIELVKTIRLNYPELRIMLNRGYDILPAVVNDIDMLLAESLYSDYDFRHKRYRRVPEAEYQATLAVLHQAQAQNPRLQLFSLDYWPADEPQVIAQIYQVELANGLSPYVATIDLQHIIPRPAP